MATKLILFLNPNLDGDAEAWASGDASARALAYGACAEFASDLGITPPNVYAIPLADTPLAGDGTTNDPDASYPPRGYRIPVPVFAQATFVSDPWFAANGLTMVATAPSDIRYSPAKPWGVASY